MKKVAISTLLIFPCAFGMVVASTCWAGNGYIPPSINHSKMMLEHKDMACTNCHGEHGPKGVDMGPIRPGQACTECHRVKKTVAKSHQKKLRLKGAPPLLGSMMLEHEGMNCTTCHGENGPKDVAMHNKPGQMCQECHKKAAKK